MKKVISTPKGPAAVGPYSQAIQTGNMIFVSGQLGLVPETGEFAEGGVEAQAEQSMKNAIAILEEAGFTAQDIVKVTMLMTDMNDFAKANAVYAKFFTSDFPARSAFQVTALPKGGLIEFEVIASKM